MKKKLTDWFPANAINPARIGYYEVGHSKPMHHSSSFRLTGYPTRYWNGKNWIAWGVDGKVSIFGRHETHQWRGLARRPSKGSK